jgi:hypothetical protein
MYHRTAAFAGTQLNPEVKKHAQLSAVQNQLQDAWVKLLKNVNKRT